MHPLNNLVHLQLLRLSIQVLLYLTPFDRISNVNLCPLPGRSPVWGLGWTGVEDGTYRNVTPTFLFNFYTLEA